MCSGPVGDGAKRTLTSVILNEFQISGKDSYMSWICYYSGSNESEFALYIDFTVILADSKRYKV